MTVTYMISEGAAYGITYGALGVFAIAVGIAVPSLVATARDSGKEGSEIWYSARNSQGFLSIGLSCFASSMGAWVLFAAPEVGAGPARWWGVIGYAIASTLPFGVFCVVGPVIRRRFPAGFCLLDWVHDRFGRATQIYVGLCSVFYMWIYLVAELTSMGNLIRDFSGLDPMYALLPVSLVTMIYTMIGGLQASIWTDRVQGVIMVILVCVAAIACFSGVKMKSEHWRAVSDWNDKGFETLVTLILAIIGAELFNMSVWQRVYAAQDEPQLRRGLMLGMALIFPTMILFGVAGMLAAGQDMGRPASTLVIPALAFFDLLGSQPGWVQSLTYCLATCMVASSVDSLQTGLVSTLSREIMQRKFSPQLTTLLGAGLLATVNGAAIILAAESTKDALLGLNILDLFLIADLVLLSITVPIFSGLSSITTQTGALAGCFSGVLLIMSFGWVEFGTFTAGLEMLTLMAFGNVEPLESGLTASRTCIIFFLLPIVTGAMTFMASWMERVLFYFDEKYGPNASNGSGEELSGLKACSVGGDAAEGIAEL
mmetsp:Transcript_53580/g.149024  ORF Transcript_53580/g.149024 Transcript_53580/m.149024 type:complete len:541 (+) Transcript_53580:163-1785(+)